MASVCDTSVRFKRDGLLKVRIARHGGTGGKEAKEGKQCHPNKDSSKIARCYDITVSPARLYKV
jgi:hypothetical protein